MALSTQERQIVQDAKNLGRTKEQAISALSAFRESSQSPAPKKPLSNRIAEGLGLGGAVDTFGSLLARQGAGPQTREQGQELVEQPTAGQVTGAVLQTAAIPAAAAITGGGSIAGQVAAGAGAGFAYDVGQDLIDQKSAIEVATPGFGTVAGAVAPLALAGGAAALGALKQPLQTGAEAVANTASKALPDSQTVQGVRQAASEVAERVPRFIGKVADRVQESAVRAERIRTSPPVIQEAIKSGLPDPLIVPIQEANNVTKQAFSEVLDIADTPRTKLGQKANPAVVGGNRASQQYDVIEAQRKSIGEAMNTETAKLGRDASVDMTSAFSRLDGVLEELRITPKFKVNEKTGVSTFDGLDFTRSKLTGKQRTVAEDLYQKATEGGTSQSPLEIREKDQLFSAIQREARSDAVQDVIITTADGQTTDLFRAFRDVYSGELDVLSPEIKRLNSQYRNVATLLDDIENSIFKTPNFEITKSTDPSEFAKVNLRRIFGEAQSSPAYEAIADEMDTISRQLGYDGASPKEVAAFAEEIRALYPENTPKAGFQGGIRAGVADIASSVLELGKADTTDQRAALRELLKQVSQ